MVLKNKLGITESTELAREEERISKGNALRLFESREMARMVPGSFEVLAEIHRALFGDIYDFAGEVREENLAKGNFRFAPVMYLKEAIRGVEKMPQGSFDEIVEKYIEMNIVHPFREGNGRAMRIWVDQIFKKELGMVVDWSRIDREDNLLAI